MSVIAIETNSKFQNDVSITPEAFESLEKVQSAYEIFSACPSDRMVRSNYFSAVNELHTKLFYDAGCYMHRDTFLNKAEKMLVDGGDFKYFILSRYRLAGPAKEYLESFNNLNNVLSSSTVNVSEVKEKIRHLAKDHFTFADKMVVETKNVQYYRGLISLISRYSFGL